MNGINRLDEAKKLLFLGDTASAKTIYQKCLKKEPSNFEALHGMSLAFFIEDRWKSAEKYLLKALKIKPNDPELYYNLGILYLKWEEGDRAALSFEKAIRLYKTPQKERDPHKYCRVVKLLSEIYISQLKFVEAKKTLVMALKTTDQENADLLKMLAQAYVGLHQYKHAISVIERLPIDSVMREALKTEIYLLKGDYDSALKCAELCVEKDSKNPHFLSLLGECYLKTADLKRSMGMFKRGLKIDPSNFQMLSRLLSLQVRLCEWEGRQEVIGNLRKKIFSGSSPNELALIRPSVAIVAGFSNDELQKVVQAHCKKIELLTQPVAKGLHFVYRKVLKKKLKIGYLSCDFRNHPTAQLMLEIFGLHDKKKFTIHAYSYGTDDRSKYRNKIIHDCDQFTDIRQMSDVSAARHIHHDGIDILVDLNGHMPNNRLGMLALRPAPVQIHYLGYPGTIGASFVDYLIVDHALVPSTERKYYSEALVYLPGSYQANPRSIDCLKKPLDRKEYGLPADHFVFCCFNQNDKFDTEAVEAWLAILQKVPNSVLWVWDNYPELKNKLTVFGKKREIHPKRFIMAPTEPQARHLARMRLADLFLDTFNYGAHTTCSEAIRIGLPLLALPGRTFASRVASSLLKLVRLDELIAKSREDYIVKAVEFAHNPLKLAKIKQKIAQNREGTVLYDPLAFTQNLETTFFRMWECFVAGRKPEDILVP